MRKSLREQGDERVKESSRRFFKEEVTSYGIKAAAVRKTGKEAYAEIRNRSKSEIFTLCEELWQSGYFEEGIIACDWSYNLRKTYLPEDFAIFERWIDRYVNNWATCDTLCNHTVGEFLEMYPQFLPELYRWARSGNRWKRRAAAVSLIIPARRGKFLDEILGVAFFCCTTVTIWCRKATVGCSKQLRKYTCGRFSNLFLRIRLLSPGQPCAMPLKRCQPN